MYRVTYDKFIELLERGGCDVALAGLEKQNLEPTDIETIEINFNIDDEDTDDEVLTITEFNIYLTSNVVLFGDQLKHDADFMIDWARTKPLEDFKRIGQPKVKMENVHKPVKQALNYLNERALDHCEYAETSEEKYAGYKECDKAFARVTDYLESTTDRMELVRGKLGDLSRVIEKQCGDAEADDEINKRIDEIYNLLITNFATVEGPVEGA